MPAPDLSIDVGLVRRLLAEQHPDLAGERVEPFAHGWDNELFAVGDTLLARLPRREIAAELVEHEQRWLPLLASRLPLPTPVPTHTGRPGCGYPWAWSLTPRLPGTAALLAPFDDDRLAARSLGAFVAAMRTDAPPDAPRNPYRGVPLRERDTKVRANLDAIGDRFDRAAVSRAWESALAAPHWDGPPQWLHGDLHAGNVLVHDGKLHAVIDFGDVTSGDPATDLGVAWMLFDADADARSEFRIAAQAHHDDALWARGRGWALAVALAVIPGSADQPAMRAMGLRTVERVLDRSG